MAKRLDQAEVQERFDELLDEIERGEVIEITRAGRVIALFRRSDPNAEDSSAETDKTV
jgi:antitoxin (DNA-binding transcriptional repressor) of toxin-antitoxin stability system